MKRKKFLQKILDTQLKTKIIETFGKNSYIKVSNLTHVKSLDRYMINVTLYIDDIENSMELYPDGLQLIVRMGWVAIGDGKPIIISSSIDTI
jgi:hypothetical protein